MLSDDLGTKRAATEEESDSSVSKKPKIEDEDDTCMEDEGDSDSDSNNPFLWSTDEEKDDSPTINYSNLQDPEPEWDKDSYDGYELEFDADGREGFPDDKAYQDFRDYKTKAFKSRVMLWFPLSCYPHNEWNDSKYFLTFSFFFFLF